MGWGHFRKQEGYSGHVRHTHMITVPSVNDDLTDEVPELKDFKTLRGSIVKIETLVVELKITVNFRGVICTFFQNKKVIVMLNEGVRKGRLKWSTRLVNITSSVIRVLT